MNLKKIRSRKALKFLGLLISAMLIATVSAVTYRYMYIDGSITIGMPTLVWIKGEDAPGDASISGSTATLDFHVEEGTPLNFTDAIFLKNNGTSGSVSFDIDVTTAVLSSDFERAKMHINTNSTGSWVYVDTLDLTVDTDSYTGSLNQGDYLRMTFEVNATISTGTKAFGIQVEY